VQLSEPDTYFINAKISRLGVEINGLNALKLKIENYDENVKNAKCTLCQVCAAPDCQFKQIELTPLTDLQNELSKHESIETLEKQLQNLESQKIDYLRDFEANKESEILRLEKEIELGLKRNAALLVNFERQDYKTRKQIDEIKKNNVDIFIKNSNNAATFETDKAQKIGDLKKQLHTLPALDYSEIDEKVLALCKLRRDQQNIIDNYNELNGSWIYAQNRITVLTDELKQLKEALFAFERELIKIEKAENDYYNDFENLINNEMPENIKVSLFKKNLSNDDYSECFEIEFNGSIYAGNGRAVSFYIWLCSWFQSKFSKDLPIFIDEAIILNKKLYSDVKNTVVLMRNDDCKTLKISEL
jgi:hypothetical protein